jgi:hypothetical protein
VNSSLRSALIFSRVSHATNQHPSSFRHFSCSGFPHRWRIFRYVPSICRHLCKLLAIILRLHASADLVGVSRLLSYLITDLLNSEQRGRRVGFGGRPLESRCVHVYSSRTSTPVRAYGHLPWQAVAAPSMNRRKLQRTLPEAMHSPPSRDLGSARIPPPRQWPRLDDTRNGPCVLSLSAPSSA